MLSHFISNPISYSYQSFTVHLKKDWKENEAVLVPNLAM